MSKESLNSLVAEKILTGGRRTSAAFTREVLLEMIAEMATLVLQFDDVISNTNNSGQVQLSAESTLLYHRTQLFFQSAKYTFDGLAPLQMAAFDRDGNLISVPYGSVNVSEGITAHPGGGQSGAEELDAVYNEVDTVAIANDSVKMNGALLGMVKEVSNQGGNDMELFPAVGERFKKGTTLLAINSSIIVSAGNTMKFVCYGDGVWRFN